MLGLFAVFASFAIGITDQFSFISQTQNEEFIRKDVDELELFEKELKGELTVVISEKKINKNLSQKLSESDMNLIKKMINKLSTKEITDIISQISDVSKKEIYNYCLELKNEK